MARKKAQEQLELIDTKPENSKKIIAMAKRYKQAQSERVTALAEEIARKQDLLDLIKHEHLQPMEGGKIELDLDGFKITVTPRDELVKVKDKNEEGTEE